MSEILDVALRELATHKMGLYATLAIFGAAPWLEGDTFKRSERFRGFMHEFVGMVVLVLLVFVCPTIASLHHWVTEWAVHGVGCMVADFICGGPHVAASVSFAMWANGNISLGDVAVRVAGQFGGAIIGLNVAPQVTRWCCGTDMGGPVWDSATFSLGATALTEFMANLVLVLSVFVFCTTWFGHGAYTKPLVFLRKASVMAAMVRAIIVFAPASGPAINPAIATVWTARLLGGPLPPDASHYLIYWLAGCAGGVAAANLWWLIQWVLRGRAHAKAD